MSIYTLKLEVINFLGTQGVILFEIRTSGTKGIKAWF